MNAYYLFYCRAYDWYNTNNKKSKDTLRGSALALLSALPVIHLLTLVGIIGVINKHTPLNKWFALIISFGLIVFNWQLITTEKSDMLREEYLSINENKKGKINRWFYCYLILSLLLLISMLAYTAYYKNKYGNYDNE